MIIFLILSCSEISKPKPEENYKTLVVDYEKELSNFKFLDGKLYWKDEPFSGKINSSKSYKKGELRYKYNLELEFRRGYPSVTFEGMNFPSDNFNQDLFFKKTRGEYKFVGGKKWGDYLLFYKQNILEKNQKIFTRKMYKYEDEFDSVGTLVGEVEFNFNNDQIKVYLLPGRYPWTDKPLKLKIESNFSKKVSSDGVLDYVLDDEFIVYNENGNIQTRGKFDKGELDGGWLSYDDEGDLIIPDVTNSRNVSGNCEIFIRRHLRGINKTVQYVHNDGYLYFGEFFDPVHLKNFFFKITVNDDCEIINVDIN